VHRAGSMAGAQPVFEISRQTGGTISYVVAYDRALGDNASSVVAEIEIGARAVSGTLRLDLDPSVTLLGNLSGTSKATVAGGTLTVSGTVLDGAVNSPRTRE